MNPGKQVREKMWRRTRRNLASSELGMGLSVALALPFILICAPFVLTAHALTERDRGCPNCGLRGTLQPEAPASSKEHGLDDHLTIRRRVSPELTVLKCKGCGAEFRRGELPG